MPTATWYLQKNTCSGGAIVVGMAACIVHLIMSMFPNLEEPCYGRKEQTDNCFCWLTKQYFHRNSWISSYTRSLMAKKIASIKKEKPVALNPSGSKESSFFEQVYDVARQIPKGRVTTYGAIASCLGTKLSARMVGWAMNGAGIIKPKVPAHRVVNRNGMLSGKHHFGGNRMQELLEKEGTKVENDTVLDFEKKFWDPAADLL